MLSDRTMALNMHQYQTKSTLHTNAGLSAVSTQATKTAKSYTQRIERDFHSRNHSNTVQQNHVHSALTQRRVESYLSRNDDRHKTAYKIYKQSQVKDDPLKRHIVRFEQLQRQNMDREHYNFWKPKRYSEPYHHQYKS